MVSAEAMRIGPTSEAMRLEPAARVRLAKRLPARREGKEGPMVGRGLVRSRMAQLNIRGQRSWGRFWIRQLTRRILPELLLLVLNPHVQQA